MSRILYIQTSVNCKCNIYFFLRMVFCNSQCIGSMNAYPIAPSQVSDPLTLPSFDEVQLLVEKAAPVAPMIETIEGVSDSVNSMRRGCLSYSPFASFKSFDTPKF